VRGRSSGQELDGASNRSVSGPQLRLGRRGMKRHAPAARPPTGGFLVGFYFYFGGRSSRAKREALMLRGHGTD
jgi:hypothetical protein